MLKEWTSNLPQSSGILSVTRSSLGVMIYVSRSVNYHHFFCVCVIQLFSTSAIYLYILFRCLIKCRGQKYLRNNFFILNCLRFVPTDRNSRKRAVNWEQVWHLYRPDTACPEFKIIFQLLAWICRLLSRLFFSPAVNKKFACIAETGPVALQWLKSSWIKIYSFPWETFSCLRKYVCIWYTYSIR